MKTNIATMRKRRRLGQSYNSLQQNNLTADRLSILPENLIESILQQLPVRDAVRTSILSTNWRYVWTTLPVLVFDEQFSENMRMETFPGVISQVLFHHSGPILKFNLHIPETSFDMYQEISAWMSFLSRNRVKELTLTSTEKRYELPSYVFSCSELTILKVENYIFKTPTTKFEGFSNLEVLQFYNVDFGVNPSGTVGNFPNLRKLGLFKCTGVHNFDINAANLSYLGVFHCPDAIFPLLAKHQYVTTVALGSAKPLQLSDNKTNLGKLLCNLKKMENLYIGGSLLKYLSAEKIPERFPTDITSLNCLLLHTIELNDLDQLRSVLCLLRSVPNLTSLDHVFQRHATMQPDKEQNVSILEASNCLERPLNKLLEVRVKLLQGSRIQLLFIKLILAQSPSLMKLTIHQSRTCDAKTRLRSERNIKGFHRASPKTEIIFLDPYTYA